ncbi:MAG: hypothetical protein ACPGJV_07390 [Bacteriovoracaceae bacterium]
MKETSFILFTFLVLSFSYSASAKDLPKFLTKQEISNLRYLSSDGKYTYYQMKSGRLNLSLNYKTEKVLEYEKGAHYSILDYPGSDNLVVTVDETYHTRFSFRKLKKIFRLKRGTANARFLIEGISPKLHMNGTWVSVYNPYAREIHFLNLISPAERFHIKLSNRVYQYFTPQAEMLADGRVVYTDINASGQMGLIYFQRSPLKQKTILKTNSQGLSIETCMNKSQLFILEKGLVPSQKQTHLYHIKKNEIPGNKKPKLLYQSGLNDLGMISCRLSDSQIYFIKNYSTQNKNAFDVARIDLKQKTVSRITQMEKIFSLIRMDQTLLVPYKGEYYVALGNADIKKVDNLTK